MGLVATAARHADIRRKRSLWSFVRSRPRRRGTGVCFDYRAAAKRERRTPPPRSSEQRCLISRVDRLGARYLQARLLQERAFIYDAGKSAAQKVGRSRSGG